MASPLDIVNLTARLSAAYPNWNISDLTNEIYYEDLKDLGADELMLAAQHCRTSTQRDTRFAPSTGELRKAVEDMRNMARNVPSAFAAWEEVLRQININGGDFGNPVWSSPLIEKAVKYIGWRELRMSENQTADRARFIQCYEQLIERASKEEMLPPQIRGYVEAGGGKMLETNSQIKQLAKGMEK